MSFKNGFLAIALMSGLLALLYGVTDEWHQTMVPTRSGRVEHRTGERGRSHRPSSRMYATTQFRS